MSNVLPFQQNDYRITFLSGGYSAWRNHSNFWPIQGFDHYFGREDVESHFNIKSDNPWGVYDEYLFEYLKKQSLDAEKANTPLFSFVMTTNNHPPVKLPTSYKAPPLSMADFNQEFDEEKIQMLEEFHYQTDLLGKFLTWLKHNELGEKIIVVATGDHILKGFNNYSATNLKYLRYAVPAYFYVPEAYDKLKNVSPNITASHTDLFSTIFELALSDTKYYSFGKPLMENSIDKSFGWIDQGSYLFDNGIVDVKTNKEYHWQDSASTILADTEHPISKDKSVIIAQNRQKTMLKQYMLIQDYENVSVK